MKVKRLSYLGLKDEETNLGTPTKSNHLVLSRSFPRTVCVTSTKRLSEINVTFRDNRDELLPLLVDEGAGFWAKEDLSPPSRMERIADTLLGRTSPGGFVQTDIEVKPVSLLAALRIAQIYGWTTSLDYAVFDVEHDDAPGTSAFYAYSEERVIELLEAMA